MNENNTFVPQILQGKNNAAPIQLCALAEEHLVALSEYFARNMKYHKAWFPITEDIHTIEGQRRRFDVYAPLHAAGKEYRFVLLHDGAVIGAVNHTAIERGVFQNGRYGYSMDEGFTGQNLITQALRCIMDFSFNALLLHRVEANIMPSNVASQRVVEKCGFMRVGYSPRYLYVNGKWEDHILYACLNPEEEKSQPRF